MDTMPMFSKKTYQHLSHQESEIWGKEKTGQRVSWFDSPLIARYIHRRISGNPDQDWLDYVKANYLSKAASTGLNVGCGHGELERMIVRRGIVETMDGFDISPKAVERAGEIARREGLSDRVRYTVADANYLDKADLRGDYDVVFASMALHHFAHLDRSLQGIKRRLKPNGLLIVNEFIGPNRFQWTDRQLAAANAILRCFPLEVKQNLHNPGEYIEERIRPTVEYMIKHFAFESVCSQEIPAALGQYFTIIDRKDYGGTVLHLLFDSIMGNFNEETDREHAIMIQLAIAAEELLIDQGAIVSDHALFVCRP